MKRVSLKQLKAMRDTINDCLPNYLKQRAFITAFAHDIDGAGQINITKTLQEYAECKDANWTYKLVIGEVIKELNN
jgi:hypothetical protein